MRAAEFLNEHAEHFNGIDLSLEIQKDDEYVDDDDYENQVVYVRATSNGKELGYVIFSFDGEYLVPQDLEVEERFRGQGIAQIMYDYTKSKGYKIRRSSDQTPAGAGFWNKHRGKERVWEDREIVKNRWALLVSTPDKDQWADNLADLVHNAYQHTSLGSFVQNAAQVNASDWVALDWDPEPDLDCTVFYRGPRAKESWTGHKIQGIGHDGKPESKQKVIQRTKALLTKPGNWIESSDAMARTLGKAGLQPVTDTETLQALFPDTDLQVLDRNGTYERTAGNARIREQVFGIPVIK